MTDQNEIESPTSLESWSSVIKKDAKQWLPFYAAMLGTGVTNIPRFYRSVKLYGFFPMLEAIVETSGRDITGDPLAYTLKVAANKWREKQEEVNEQIDYLQSVDESKKASAASNKKLAAKIARRKKVR